MMTWLWTWSGKCTGYRNRKDLWTFDGRHVGKFVGKDIFGSDGRYLGELSSDNRLIRSTNKKSLVNHSFEPYKNRASFERMPDIEPRKVPLGYEDFFLPPPSGK